MNGFAAVPPWDAAVFAVAQFASPEQCRGMLGRSLTLILTTAIAASPALAQSGGSSIPDPSGIALFGMGLAGVIIGRHFSRKRPD
jgi:hypothetical protein